MGSLGLSSGAPLLESRREEAPLGALFSLFLSLRSSLFSSSFCCSLVLRNNSTVLRRSCDNASYRFPVLGLYFVLYTNGFVFALVKGVGTTTLRD